jgi:SAM-dependent methyltransferase
MPMSGNLDATTHRFDVTSPTTLPPGESMEDLAPIFTIRFSSHRIINPLDDAKLAALGAGLHLEPEHRVLDLACGTGELLNTWARDHGVSGHGVDLSSDFIARAQARADELGVASRVTFEQRDAENYVGSEQVEVGACLGADWIGGGSDGTVALLERNVVPGGLILIGQPFWNETPPDEQTARECGQGSVDAYPELSDLLAHFSATGYDIVEMVCADAGSWDRYTTAQWWNIRQWLDHAPHAPTDLELVEQLRDELVQGPVRYALFRRRYLGWGVFALRAQ